MKAILARLTAIAGLLLAGHASAAMRLNPNGVGDLLLFPYYTVNKGQDTLLTLVNMESSITVVRVRFNEGRNGRPVLELDVYLGPNDVWTAAVTADGAGRAKLTSPDSSCTIPSIPAGGIRFTTSNFDGSGALPADAWPNDPARTREGSIEMLQVGFVSDQPAVQALTRPSGAAPDCEGLRANLPTLPTMEGSYDRGLYGSAAIINVGEGTLFSYAPDAIAEFSYGMKYVPSLAPAPLSAPLDAPSVLAEEHTFDALLGSVPIVYPTRIDALSAVLMTHWIENEYLVAPDLGGSTDWIVTFPTKAYYVDPLHIGSGAPLEPFEVAQDDSRAAVHVSFAVFDRNQKRNPPSSVAPQTWLPVTLPYQVNVLDIGSGQGAVASSGVFGSTLVTTLPAVGEAGRIHLNLSDNTAPGATTGHVLRTGTLFFSFALEPPGIGNVAGLPATGFMAYNIINANAQPGKLANYSAAFRHRAKGIVCQYVELASFCKSY